MEQSTIGISNKPGYCGPFEHRKGTLSRVNFPGGYVVDGVAYHYIHDHHGNVRQVVNAATGAVVQENSSE